MDGEPDILQHRIEVAARRPVPDRGGRSGLEVDRMKRMKAAEIHGLNRKRVGLQPVTGTLLRPKSATRPLNSARISSHSIIEPS